MGSDGVFLGSGVFGTVHATVCKINHGPSWAEQGCLVAQKRYKQQADGVLALRCIRDVAATLQTLVGVVVPVCVASTCPAAIIMPVCTPPPNSWHTRVLPLATRLLAGGLVMSDIKPANLGVLEDQLLLLDAESITKPVGMFNGLGSFPVVLWFRWAGWPPELGCARGLSINNVTQRKELNTAVYDDHYFTCNQEIVDMLSSDADCAYGLTLHSALSTALCMRDGSSLPAVTAKTSESLGAHGVEAYSMMMQKFSTSPLIAEARARDACTLDVL